MRHPKSLAADYETAKAQLESNDIPPHTGKYIVIIT